jgi:hypothetical protein
MTITVGRSHHVSRPVLGALAALAVALGAVAAPPAGTAHAGGAAGGVVGSRQQQTLGGAAGGIVGSREQHTLGGVCRSDQEPRVTASSVSSCPPALPTPAQAPDGGHEGRKAAASSDSGV